MNMNKYEPTLQVLGAKLSYVDFRSTFGQLISQNIKIYNNDLHNDGGSSFYTLYKSVFN